MNLCIAKLRKEAHLTQNEVARKIGVSAKTLWNWENGETVPDCEQLWNCAIALGCSPNDILGWNEETGSGLASAFEHELLECYRACTPARKDRILDTARDAAGMSKEATERASHEPKQQAAC